MRAAGGGEIVEHGRDKRRVSGGLHPCRMDLGRLGRGIRALRRRRGWRQDDLAAAAGVSRAQVSRVELGDGAAITIGVIEHIVAAAGGSLDVLLRWQGEGLDRLVDARTPAWSSNWSPGSGPPAGRWLSRCRSRATGSAGRSTCSPGTRRDGRSRYSRSSPSHRTCRRCSWASIGRAAWRRRSPGSEAGTRSPPRGSSSSETRARTATASRAMPRRLMRRCPPAPERCAGGWPTRAARGSPACCSSGMTAPRALWEAGGTVSASRVRRPARPAPREVRNGRRAGVPGEVRG